MSATSGTIRDDRMLPGITAFGWTRVNLVLYLVGMILFIPVVIAAFTGNAGSPIFFVLLIPAVLLSAFAAVASLGAFLRQRSESEAGYTTLPGASPNLDQLDFRTGAVIRRAGDPLLASRGTLAFLRGEPGRPREEVDTDQPAFAPRTPARVVASIVPVVIGIAVVVGIAFFRGIRDPLGFISLYSVILGGGVVVLGLVFVYTQATLVRRIRQIARSRPDSMIFTAAMTADIQKGMERLGITQTSISGRFPVVVTETAIELWSNETTPVLRVSVPWNEVQSLVPDSVAVSRNSFKGVDLGFTHDDVAVQFPLAIYGRQGMRGASSAWANQVFDEIRHHVVARR